MRHHQWDVTDEMEFGMVQRRLHPGAGVKARVQRVTLITPITPPYTPTADWGNWGKKRKKKRGEGGVTFFVEMLKTTDNPYGKKDSLNIAEMLLCLTEVET